MRPMYEILPSGSHEQRSPVRYITLSKASVLHGFFVNAFAVASGLLRYPRATWRPAKQSSPGTPAGQRFPAPSTI